VNEQKLDSSSDEVVFVVTRRVRLGCEQQFENWLGRISEAELEVPGFLGREDIPPLAAGQDTWTHVVRFASSADQVAWFKADSYRALIEEVRPLCTAVHRSNNIHGFGSWFTMPEQAEHGAVPTWKQAMVVLLSLYPSIYLISWAFTSHVDWPFAVKLLISNILGVAAVSWITLPLVRRCIGWWMPDSPDRSLGIEIGMVILIVAVLLGLVMLFNWMPLV
jgi:antibiotic biosynthesis monooxygenase (ABM) superfamily enzyme